MVTANKNQHMIRISLYTNVGESVKAHSWGGIGWSEGTTVQQKC